MELDKLVGVLDSLRQLDMVHSFAVLLHPQVQAVDVEQELRHVEELRDKLPHI